MSCSTSSPTTLPLNPQNLPAPQAYIDPVWRKTFSYMQMDEEDLYSAVGRQTHAAQPDEQESGQEDDSMNADTFGSALVTAANNGDRPARPAWSSAGASVALVAGSSRQVVACIFFVSVGLES